MNSRRKSMMQRIEEYVDPTGFCWHWTGALNKSGYGEVKRAGLPKTTAHRAVYEFLVGVIAPGLQLDHLCRVRHCVNPDHMEQVTIQENVARGQSFTAVNSRKTHCNSGHEFTPENTILRVGGWRACETCRYIKIREWRQKAAFEGGRQYHPRKSSHCKQGHEYTPENTLKRKNGRMCRTCDTARRERFRISRLVSDQQMMDDSIDHDKEKLGLAA